MQPRRYRPQRRKNPALVVMAPAAAARVAVVVAGHRTGERVVERILAGPHLAVLPSRRAHPPHGEKPDAAYF